MSFDHGRINREPFPYMSGGPPRYKNIGMEGPQNVTSTGGAPGVDQGTTYPRLGEQHPEGPNAAAAQGSKSDNLDFGWFSMPGAKQGVQSDLGGPDSARSDGPASTGAPDNYQYQQPPSRAGGGRPVTGSQHGAQYPPPSRAGRPDSRYQGPYSQQGTDEAINRMMVDQPESARQQCPGDSHQSYQDHQSLCQPPQPPVCDDNIVVDWPLSSAFLQASRRQEPVQPRPPYLDDRPMTDPEPPVPAVPPTPKPPLQWQPYSSNAARPTYASWHDLWHRRNDPQFQENFNNNSDDMDTPTDHMILDNFVTSGVSSRFEVSHLHHRGADFNNNNWMFFDSRKPPQRSQLITLPPYGHSSPRVPSFYSPSVVMKWEDTDDHSQAQVDSKGSKHKSFIRRIRSSVCGLLSALSCLKLQQSRAVNPREKLFKYNRFDKDEEKAKAKVRVSKGRK